MRLVIDMQGAQSVGSKTRGIGRYTLAIVQAMIRQRSTHEIHLVLNGRFTDTVNSLRATFGGILPQSQIHVWQGLYPVSYIGLSNQDRRKTNELIYEAFLSRLEPDFIYITSLFEGLSDDALSSVHRLQTLAPVAVTLYDLIPLLNPDLYLESPIVKSWYQDKIEHFKRADVWLAISESSRQEGINHLGLPPHRTHNVSTDADDMFRKIDVSAESEKSIRTRYGLEKPFVMYTGGLDHRKNVGGLLRAYSLLSKDLKSQYQLAIVCAIEPANRKLLEEQLKKLGLGLQDVLFTGFVDDRDLLTLYNLCELFIFPSWHEGFGLPALEAIRCGAPVIGANTSSLPEVIGWEEALFDPYDHLAMANMIERGLTDQTYRRALIERANIQSRQFSWDESARRALSAIQSCWAESNRSNIRVPIKTKRPKLAYVSPLPSAQSGIADYSAELLPELSKYYDIEVIVEQTEVIESPWVTNNVAIRSSDWFAKNANHFERVLYHFGNSAFHKHMFDLLEDIPGVVVLHDFFLSGIQAHREASVHNQNAWSTALFSSHGYQAIKDRFSVTNTADIIFKYPANLPVLQRSQGVVVHSQHSLELADKFYGASASKHWVTIPLLRIPPETDNRVTARQLLGYQPTDVLICSFGGLAPTKLSHRILGAWLDSALSKNPAVHLIFVGLNEGGAYGQSLQQRIDGSTAKKRIKITGWASADMFKQYLAAADVGVQLRTLSRGETSAAVLDCLNHGMATIVNAHGSMKDLDPNIVWQLPDEFTDEALIHALTSLASDPQRRAQLGEAAQRFIHHRHEPAKCAHQYYEAIEKFHARSSNGLDQLLTELRAAQLPTAEMFDVAEKLAASFPPTPRLCQLLVNVTGLMDSHSKESVQITEQDEHAHEDLVQKSKKRAQLLSMLQQWIRTAPLGYRVEPVYAAKGANSFRYARAFTFERLGVPDLGFDDAPVDAFPGDVFVDLNHQPNVAPEQIACLQEWRGRGVTMWLVVSHQLSSFRKSALKPSEGNVSPDWVAQWHNIESLLDGAAFTSEATAAQFRDGVSNSRFKLSRPLVLACLGPLTCPNNTDKLIQLLCLPNDRCNGQVQRLGGTLETVYPPSSHPGAI